MRTLEIIQLRSFGSSVEQLTELIRASLRPRGEARVDLEIYHRVDLATDLAIHIRRVDLHGVGGPSELGLRIAAELREHGFVEHSVWEHR